MIDLIKIAEISIGSLKKLIFQKEKIFLLKIFSCKKGY